MDIVTYKMAQKYAETAVQNVNNAVTELDNRLATNSTEILRRALITETGNKIELEINNQTYILTAKLYDKNNNLISTSNSIDLPLEAMIINATYNNNTKKIVLTLQSGSTVEFSIVDLIDGLVNETTFNETIEELETENIKLKQRISDLENNESTNTVSGESIDINDSANATIRNIKITGKSIQDGTPTPENPVEIQNCSNSINFKVQNVNLFNNNNIQWGKFDVYNHNFGNMVKSFINYIDVKPSETYCIKFKCSSKFRCSYQFLDAESNILSGEYYSVQTNLKVFLNKTAPSNAKKLLVSELDVGQDSDIEVLVVKGDYTSNTLPEYEEYQEQTITFPLQEGQVLAQDDYLADDGIHHVRKQVVLDGTENWTSRTNSYGNLQFYCSTPKNNMVLKDQKCNYGKFNSTTYNYGHYGDFYITNVGSSSQFFICVDENETIESFKAKLQANNLVCEYPLNQEIIEPYTSQQAQVWEQIKALRTYKNITYISSEDETKPTLEVTYVRDLPKEIDILGHHETKTQAQYDALVSGGTIDSNTYYYIVEE